MTTEEARKCREFAEHVIFTALKTLSRDTGLDIVRVEPIYYVDSAIDGEPRRMVSAVRIDLCV